MTDTPKSIDNLTTEGQALPIPEEVYALPANRVVELARVWWGGDQPYMMIRPAPEDPRLIGLILADLAWHYSNAYAAGPKLDQKAVLSRIMQAWEDGHKAREDNQSGTN